MLLALLACTDPDPPRPDRGPPPVTEDVRIGGGADDTFATRMCVAPDGVVYVLWLARGPEFYGIRLTRSVDGGYTWLAEAVPVDDGAGDAFNPDLACDETGVTVVWEADRDGELHNHQVYADRWPRDGAGFGPDVLVEPDPDGRTMSLEPRIVARGEDLAVAWYDDRDGAYDVLVATSADGGATWTEPVRVDSDPPGSAFSSRPKIARDADGTTWVAWEDSRDGDADVYVARADDPAAGFEPEVRIDGGAPGEAASFEPQLCAGGDAVYVVWHDARASETDRDVWYNGSLDGGRTWPAEPVRLDSDAEGMANSLHPRCVLSGEDLTVAWFDERDGLYGAFVREVRDGIPLAAEVRVDEGLGDTLDVRLVDEDGTVVVAWRDDRADDGPNDYDDLYYDLREPGGAFREHDLRIDSMYDGQSYKVDLQLALLDGSLLAAWTDGRAGTSDVYFQRMRLGFEANPPPPFED